MPPFYRYRRPNFYSYRRRRYNRKWRPRKTIRKRRFRRRQAVRKKRYYFKKKKLKKLRLTQWQPDRIRKCKIKGMFCLFQAGAGRYGNNFEMYKDSIVPPHEPGGGGWSIFQISLNNLYQEHAKLMNWWTKSNNDYNLCRYIQCKLKFYRTPDVDYVVQYQNQYPFEVGKFHYPSNHPQRLLMYHKKIIVPSFQTQPHNKRKYIVKRIKPPKEFINKWYFQNQFCRFGLIMISTSACSLDNFFIGPRAESNNISVLSINTKIFSHKNFRDIEHHIFGYIPNASYYMYGTQNGPLTGKPKRSQLIYLGNTTKYTEGVPIQITEEFGGTTYPLSKWGNPFYKGYVGKDQTVWISTQQPSEVLKKRTTGDTDPTIQNVERFTQDILVQCRYNPFRDKGEGNVAKWLNVNLLENGWYTEAGPEFTITGFPLWILLWGWEDWTRKNKKLNNLDTEYILVVHTQYIEPTLPAYVFMNLSWAQGEGSYHLPAAEIPTFNIFNWQPCWQYQKEAIDDILMSGPGVCKNNSQISAHMEYNFLFKWGGGPTYVEKVADPCTKPDYALPSKILQGHEIQNPQNDPTREVYNWDFRRGLLTDRATKRITRDSDSDNSLFTDGEQTTTMSVPIQKQKETPQKKKTKKKSKETLQQQLLQYQHRRQQLRQRFLQLTKQLQSTKSEPALSE
nr:MAG: ORF1 [TTV-like mini virus]